MVAEDLELTVETFKSREETKKKEETLKPDGPGLVKKVTQIQIFVIGNPTVTSAEILPVDA